ncbi:unnamed protein product, partial [Rotaria magnacalcarata]
AEKKRCNVCRLLREQDSASSSDVRLVSKPLAIGIWEEGQPANNLAMYDRPICGFDVVMSAINNALDESNHYSIKRRILAIIARFSGIGIHQIKAARKHAFDKGNMNKTTVMNEL